MAATSLTLETSNPPVPPLTENASWQAVNKAVNAKLNVTIIPFGDFNAKWATVQAGNDLPDLMCTITRPDVPIVPAFLNAKCQDLTPYLAGDAVKDYPNLAALPSRSWKSTLINGKIYGVPIPLKPYFWWFWAHQEILDQCRTAISDQRRRVQRRRAQSQESRNKISGRSPATAAHNTRSTPCRALERRLRRAQLLGGRCKRQVHVYVRNG